VDDGGLLDMSMEEVVGRFLEREKRRHLDAKDDENQQEVVIGIRSAPSGLVAILESASYQMGVSRSILTRCLSYQVASWYDSLAPISDLTRLFYVAQQKALDNGYPELCRRIKSVPYEFKLLDTEHTSLRSIAWVRSKLYDLSLPVGVSMYHLFLIGLCRSIATTDSGFFTKTIEILNGEVEYFLLHVKRRFIEIQAFDQQAGE